MTFIKRCLPLLVSLFVGFIGGGVVIVTAHGGDTTLVHSCVANSDGTIRIVAATAGCKKMSLLLIGIYKDLLALKVRLVQREILVLKVRLVQKVILG